MKNIILVLCCTALLALVGCMPCRNNDTVYTETIAWYAVEKPDPYDVFSRDAAKTPVQ